MSTRKTVLGTLTGITIGAIGGILFAPQKGSKAREQIKEKGDYYADEIKLQFIKYRDSVTEKLKSTKKDVEILVENEEATKVLNALVTINNDRIEGYQAASKETEELDLKKLFAQFISTSEQCKQELIMEVNKLGGKEAKGTKTTGKFFRVWMDVKAAITDKDRIAILNSCEYGEEKALEAYDKALADGLETLSTEQQSMITAQKALLKSDHDHIEALRNSLADV